MQFFNATCLRCFISTLFILLSSSTLLMPQSFGDNWDSHFDLPGVNGSVSASALDQDGNLYVLGNFTAAHGAPNAVGLAMWNGTEWESVGLTNSRLIVDGTEFRVLPESPLLIVGNDVHVTAQPKAAPLHSTSTYIIAWDGISWSKLGDVFDRAITHLTSDGATLYAAGVFSTIGTEQIPRLARWNGSVWADINWRSQPFGKTPITAMATDNNSNLLVANSQGSGKWDGSGWEAVGNLPVSHRIKSFASFGSVLYAFAAGPRGNQLYRLDGSTWTHLSKSFELQYDITSPLLVPDEIGSLYLLARHRDSTLSTSPSLFQFSGNTWTSFPARFSSISSITFDQQGAFFLGGKFQMADDTLLVNSITHWTGTNWERLQTKEAPVQGLTGDVADVEFVDEYLYVGGTTMASITVNDRHGILRKSKEGSWEMVGGGINGIVNSIEKNPAGGIYVGGCFINAGNVSAANVASWDGTRWNALGAGPGFCVEDLAVTANTLYAVGETALAKWDGKIWTTLTNDIQGTPLAVAAKEDGTVYVGGLFMFVGNQQVNNIAQWKDGSWTPLETGVHLYNSSHAHPGAEFAEIRDLALDGDLLYAGGRFDGAGPTEAYNIARWNGEAWESLYDGLTGITPSLQRWWEFPPIVQDLHVTANRVYAAGHFRVAGKHWEELGPYSIGSGITFMEKNVGVWEPLLPGVSTIPGEAPTVNAVTVVGDTIYLGGDFRTAGNHSSYRVARTVIPPAVINTPIVADALDFGLVPIGHSADSVVLLTNPITSTRTLVATVEIVNGPFELTDRTAVRVSPGQTIRIPVQFSPTVLGPVQGLARIRHNAMAGSKEAIVPLSGTGSVPSIAYDYSPKNIDFGTVLQEPGSRKKILQVINLSSSIQSLTIKANTLPTPFNFTQPAALETIILKPGENYPYEIEAVLDVVGDFNAELTIQHNGDLSRTITIPIHLTVVPRIARLLINPSPLEFGEVQLGTHKALGLTVQNDPASNLNQSYTFTAIKKPFKRLGGRTITLKPGETSNVLIEFRPLEVGNSQETATLLQIVGEDTILIEVPLQGHGIPGTITAEISPTELDFGNVPFPRSKEMSVRISNLAASTLSLSIEDHTGIVEPFDLKRRIQRSIQPNSTDSITIRFTPFSESAELRDTLLITHNSPDLPNPFEIVLRGSSITTGVNEHPGNSNALLQLHVEPNPVSKNGTFRFRLPQAADVLLEVFALDGRSVSRLAKGRYTAGEHRVEWNTEGLARGTYLCRLTAGEKETSVMMNVK